MQVCEVRILLRVILRKLKFGYMKERKRREKAPECFSLTFSCFWYTCNLRDNCRQNFILKMYFLMNDCMFVSFI